MIGLVSDVVPMSDPLKITPISYHLEGYKMKTYRKELWFNVPARRAFINITQQVAECLSESQIKEGLLLCNTKQN
jgi:hypothetical protein